MSTDFSIETSQLERWQDVAKFCRLWDALGSPWEPDGLRRLFDMYNAHAVLMKIGGKLVGTTAFWNTTSFGDISRTPIHFLAFVGIDAAFQGQGLGRVIVEYTLAHKKTAWELDAYNDNVRAVGLYESLGFTCVRWTIGERIRSRFRLEPKSK